MMEARISIRVCVIHFQVSYKVSDSYVSKWKIIYEKEGAEGLLMKYKGREGLLSSESIKEITGYTEECEHISPDFYPALRYGTVSCRKIMEIHEKWNSGI